MALNLTDIEALLKPGVYAVEGKYSQYPKQFPNFFVTKKSEMAVETKVQMRFVGLPNLVGDGAAIGFDNNSGQRYKYNAVHQKVGLGYAITENAIDDNLYESEFKSTNLGLVESFAEFKEIQGANVFNNGTTYNSQIVGDGKALFATDHPVDGNTVANRFTTDMGLNEASLSQAMTNVHSTFLNEAGLRANIKPKMLGVPPALEAVAGRLVRTELRPGTSNNDVNMIKYLAGGLPKGYEVNQYFTSNYAWFLTTSQEGLIYFERKPFKTDMHTDFVTNNLLVKAVERYCFVHNDWRAAFGSFPTS